MNKKKICPYCSCDKFKRTSIDKVMIIDQIDVLYDEVLEDNIEDTFFQCWNCKKDVTENELIDKPLEKGDPFYEK